MSNRNILMKIAKKIQSNPRTCEICGKKETIHDIMLAYDNGKIMCDDCSIEYYTQKENDNE